MTVRDLKSFLRIFGLVLAALFLTALPGRSDTGTFLVIADVHFNPFYDGTLFNQLQAKPAEDWGGILGASQPAGFNAMWTDSNYALLQSSLDDAAKRIPHPDFILYPGDLLAHQWQSKYDALATKSHLEDPQAYHAFTSKAVAFLVGELRRRFPGIVIAPALGNEDSYCGDYEIEPQGPFLSMFAEVWAPLLGPDGNSDAFRATFSRGGYFTMKLPGTTRQRLIVLNTVFFSVNYVNACGSQTQTPALDQYQWLEQTLRQAQAAGESVWLLMHVPPGINSFNSVESVAQGQPPVTFWQPELTGRFLQLTLNHAPILSTAFAGHTHMDDFRVVPASGNPTLLVKISPAISPVYGNNPGYQVYQYDRPSGALENYQTYYLTNLSTSGKPTLPAAASWALEYDFRQAYSADALNARAVAHLADQMRTDTAAQQKFQSFYGVSAPSEITPQSFGTYRCAIANISPAEFLTCLTGKPKPRAPLASPDRRARTGSGTSR